MTEQRLRRLALWMVGACAWLVPRHQRHSWRAQWRADVWHRCDALARAGLINPRTTRAVLARVSGAACHAAWLRVRHGRGHMLTHDLRHAVRSLKGRPGFTAVAVLTLAVGIGANAVIFSWIEATLLTPIPGIADPRSLVALYATTPTRDNLSLSYPNYVDLRDRALPGVHGVAVFSAGAMSLRAGGEAERAWGAVVSGNMFELLGVGAARGRVLTPDDDRVPGGHPVAVVSHRFWQRRFGARDDLVGATVLLNDRPFTIVGVAAPEFIGMQPFVALDVFVPVAMQSTLIAGDRLAARGSGWLQALVRLAPGATRAQAQAAVDVGARTLVERFPDVNAGRGLRLFELWRQPSGGTGMMLPVMAVLGGLVAVLLALVCANMAGLLLARASGRQREIAVRRSLGASRGQVARLIVVETLLIALAAGTLAAVLASWSGALLRAFIPPMPIPIVIDAGLSLRVLAFATLVSLGAGVLLGLVPGLHASRAELAGPLKDGTAGGGTAWRRGRVRQGLIVVQVALALVLLVSAGLFLRTLQVARQADPGFQARQGLVGFVDVGSSGYDEIRGRDAFRRMVAAVRDVPGVEAAAVGQRLPLTMTDSSDRSVQVEGYTPAPGEEMTVYYASVGDGYFATLQMPLVGGRDFTARDTADAPLVVIVNETMARRYWPGRPGLGGRVKIGDRWAEVVGIAADSKYSSMSESPRAFMYLPLDQAYRPAMRVLLRTTGDPDALVGAVRAALRAAAPAVPLFDVQTFAQHLAFAFFTFEMAATLLGLFGVTAALLAALGLYGVVAHSVGARTREIGVRMSLGATAGDVRLMVVRQGLGLAATGIALGLLAALATTRLFASQLMSISPFDATSYGLTAVVLAATTALACYVPARRAARLNPVQALRVD